MTMRSVLVPAAALLFPIAAGGQRIPVPVAVTALRQAVPARDGTS